MAPMFDGLDALLQEMLASNDLASGFRRMWTLSLVSRCEAVLEKEWIAIGQAEFYREAIELVAQPLTKDSVREIACTLGQREEEIEMAISRLRRRYDQLLQELIRDTTATSDSCAEEWRELFAGP